MSNSLANYMKSANLKVPSKTDLAKYLRDSALDNTKLGGGGEYLTFSGKSGVYAIGRSKKPIDEDELFLMEPSSMVEGKICWKGGKPVGRHIWSIFKRDTDSVEEEDLEDHGPYNAQAGEGWYTLRGFGFATLTPEKPALMGFTNNSVSGCNAIDDLKLEMAQRVDDNEPHIPLFSFSSEKFEAQGQVNYKPVFAISIWVTREAVDAFYADKLSEDKFLAGQEPRKARGKRR